MPSPLRNGAAIPPPTAAAAAATLPAAELRRLNTLILILRFASFSFSLASAIFISINSSWLHYGSFRFVFAATAIVAVYSLFEIAASLFEILRGATILPEPLQLWFDFAHDQVFGYMVVAAAAAGVEAARGMKRARRCQVDHAFCVQVDIAVALGFGGFAFLAIAAVASGFRLACHVITGTRFRH